MGVCRTDIWVVFNLSIDVITGGPKISRREFSVKQVRVVSVLVLVFLA